MHETAKAFRFDTRWRRAAPRRRLGSGPAAGARGRILDLGDPAAEDPSVAGAKAANLALASAAGLPVLPGAVLATGTPPDGASLRAAWERLSGGGSRSLVVRSSSTIEDVGESSMAGQFRSVLGVRDWDDFRRAVADVLGSAARVGTPGSPPAPMAVLIQQELVPSRAGVLFGVDPVSGDRRHLMIEAVEGSPHALVSGEVTASLYVTTRRGHVLERPALDLLTSSERRRLARLARRAEEVFGRPQDVEWGFDGSGRLWLLQSRPVTATGSAGSAAGPLLGPGPVSETFPLPLRPLEVDLWVAPLRAGIAEAMRLTGAASRRRLEGSPVVVVAGGRVAVDLDLFGAAPTSHPVLRALDPRRPAHHLAAAWRVGQVRAALPSVAAETVAGVDRHLAAVPSLDSMTDDDLLGLLRRAPAELVTLHAREVLAGMLLRDDDVRPTAAALALAALAAGRTAGWPDPETAARRPVTLVLTPPRVGAGPELPPSRAGDGPAGTLAGLGGREALRLRARWVQEVTARAAAELGRRLAVAGRLPHGADVALLTLDELAAVVALTAPPPPAGVLADRAAASAGPPLPAAFRLTADGEVVAVAMRAAGAPPGGRAAGGGRGVGDVSHDPTAGGGRVLVVETLSPELAVVLPGLAGLVSETGSTLSHLAILAREFGVPTVVGVPDARRRFPVGTTVVVDGRTGEVSLVRADEGGCR